MYCGVCGAAVSQPVKSHRERLLLFITPLFLVLFCIALSYELGVVDPLDAGLSLAGTIVMVFLGAAGIFATFVWLFAIPALPESYWHAGFLAVVQFTACGFLLHNLEPVLLGEFPANIGPVAYVQARAEIFAVTFLPLLFAGLLSVSARARIMRFPDSAASLFLRFVFKNTMLLLPLLTILAAAGLYLSSSAGAKSTIRAGIAYDLAAITLTISIADQGL